VSLYANAYKRFPKPHYKKIISETIDFITRELKHPEAGFYSALDADSEGEEGKYYVWSYKELSEFLSDKELSLAENYFNCTKRGNWESSNNILFTNQSPLDYAKAKNLDPDAFEKEIEDLKQTLFDHRQQRVRPSLDDKMITSWNAMMITGLVEAFTALRKDEYLELAESATEFLLRTRLVDNNQLLRTYKNQKSITGFLEDYAFTIEALIKLYQITFKIDYLNKARHLAEICFNDFKTESSSMFQFASKISEKLISKTYEINDNVIPASNSSLAKSLFLLGKFFDEDKYLETSKRMLNQMEAKLYKSGPYAANWQVLYGWLTFPFYEVAIMGEKAQDLSLELQKEYHSNCIFLGGQSEDLSILENKKPKDPSETIIYVCENKICQKPTSDIEKAKELLK
jgi:uncharacterized protein YyaL (SSP411 family)